MTNFLTMKPCRRCGDTRRYEISRSCPTCQRARAKGRPSTYKPIPKELQKRKGRQPGPIPCVDKQAFTVRLPASLYLQIHDHAQNEKRTLGAQVEHDLEFIYNLRERSKA